MKQTAVEWLVDEILDDQGGIITYAFKYGVDLTGFINIVKEMEKEQMSNAMLHGWRKALDPDVHSIDPNDFYNETFKSE